MIPADFIAHYETHFGQVKALVYMAYGYLGVDCESVTRRAFSETLRVWGMEHPISFTRTAALELAAEEVRGRRASGAMAEASIEKALQSVVGPRTRAALRIIDSLSPKQRIAFLWVDVFNLPPAEVADVIGRGAYRVHLHKARKRLAAAGINLDDLTDDLGRLS